MLTYKKLNTIMDAVMQKYPLRRLSRDENYRSFIEIKQFFDKVSQNHAESEIDPIEDLSRLRKLLQVHWNRCRLDNSLADTFPHNFFIDLIHALIKVGLIDKRYLNLNISHESYNIHPNIHNQASIERSIFDIPLERLYLAKDRYYYDIKDLLDYQKNWALNHFANREILFQPNEFFTGFYQSLSSTLKPTVLNYLLNCDLAQLQALLKINKPNNTNFSLEFSIKMCFFDLLTFVHKLNLNENQKAVVKYIHEEYQMYDAPYKEAQYLQLKDGHLFPARRLIELTTAEGLTNPNTHQVVYAKSQMHEIYALLPEDHRVEFIKHIFPALAPQAIGEFYQNLPIHFYPTFMTQAFEQWQHMPNHCFSAENIKQHAALGKLALHMLEYAKIQGKAFIDKHENALVTLFSGLGRTNDTGFVGADSNFANVYSRTFPSPSSSPRISAAQLMATTGVHQRPKGETTADSQSTTSRSPSPGSDAANDGRRTPSPKHEAGSDSSRATSSSSDVGSKQPRK